VPWWEDLLVRDDDFIQDGRIRVPDAPGLGIELDWDVVAEHRTDA
jgi:L-alanine-DL-glutamate epimerase-like enolase superfamily enzyme